METGTATDFIRSAQLSDQQRQFLSQYTIDPAVQRSIPTSFVGESVNLSAITVGLLLTHQPLVARFYWYDYFKVSQLINGRADGYLTILPSGYDYDLTHSLYLLARGSLARTISTSELSIPGVELVGAYTFEREEMAVFLEETHRNWFRGGNTKARFTGASKIVPWLAIAPPRRGYSEPPAGIQMNLFDQRKYVKSLRSESSLHLYSGRDIWIRHLGMDWPEYFLSCAGNVCFLDFPKC